MTDSVRTRLLAMLMLLSGLAGISYEILYGRILGNMIGDQFAVSASVLITFLLGIGLGSAMAHRLRRWLWAIEAGIGAYGAAIAWMQPSVQSFVYAAQAAIGGRLEGAVGIGVLVLLPPAFLIGCSVPLFASLLDRMGEASGQARKTFSRTYAIYNFGAAITAVLIEFWLIRALGIRGGVTLFAAINAIIAAILFVGFRDVRDAGSVAGHSGDGVASLWERLRRMDAWRLTALALASMASAIFQLFMVKYAELVFGPFRESFALVLALTLLGIAIGSALARRAGLGLARVVGWMPPALGLTLLLANGAIYVYAALHDLAGGSFLALIMLKALTLTALMLPPAVLFGATVPAMMNDDEEVSRQSGALLFVSSLANVAGFLLMTFVLHRFLDYGVQLLATCALAALAWVAARRFRPKPAAASLAGLALLAGWLHAYWDEDLLYLSYTKFHSLHSLRKARAEFNFPDRYKGYQDVFSINWMHGKPFFFINGYISIPLNSPSEKIVGALGALYSPRLDDALVLGLGSGATASTVGLFFRHTDVVEINPVVRANLFRMRKWNYDIEHNPRVNIVVDDGIHFLRSKGQRYSLILNTVTTPLYFSSAKLYGKEFFDDVSRRLKPDGIYVTWMDSRIGDKGADIILRTLRRTFRHCAILYVKSAYFLLVAANQPVGPRQQPAIESNQPFRADMMKRYGVMADWLQYHYLTNRAYALIGDVSGPVNRADRPVLEFEMARLHRPSLAGFKQRLRQAFSVRELRAAFAHPPEGFPADYLLHAEDRLDNTSIVRAWRARIARLPGFPRLLNLAELHRRQARARLTDTANAWHDYGYQLIVLQRYAEAASAFKRVIKIDPRHNNAHYNLGVCLEHLKQYRRALQAFHDEKRIDPNDEDVDYRIGRLHARLHEPEQAIRALSEYIRNSKRPTRKAFLYRALAWRERGRNAEARGDLMRALGLDGEESSLATKLGL